eukprot:2910363-Alexandrium_andersonii.AAC.1
MREGNSAQAGGPAELFGHERLEGRCRWQGHARARRSEEVPVASNLRAKAPIHRGLASVAEEGGPDD